MHTVNYFDNVFTDFCFIILGVAELSTNYFASIMLREKAHVPVWNMFCGSESKVNTKFLILLTSNNVELKSVH
jgi:hypothetical protein